MRLRIPGFGCALATSVTLFGSGCGAAAPPPKAVAADSAAAPTAAPGMPSPLALSDTAPEPASAPPPPPPPPSVPAADRGAGATPPAPLPSGATLTTHREMLDIEANVTMQVPRVKGALKALHQLASRLGGVVTDERVDTASEYGAAQLTLRVPSGAAQSVFDALEELGRVQNQSVTARDIGKEYFDANLRLSSLEATLHRYEQVLTQATKVEEILRIEQELARLRGEIEQVKGNLRWLSDRAARATLHISLSERAPEIAHSPEPEAKFFPGLRLPALADFGKKSTDAYVGGGFALRFSRSVSLDLDLFRRQGSEARGPDAILASIGGEIYSNLLGGGERRYLNPYLGWRAGYARFDSDNQATLGATLGLELYNGRVLGVDLEARNYLAFGGSRGGHYLLTPALTARVAF